MEARQITSPYPYISLQDLGSVVGRLAPDMASSQVTVIENELHAIQKQFAPELATFYELDANELSLELEERVETELMRTDAKVGVISLDKEIAKTMDSSHIFRLNISRSSDNKLVARIGTRQSPSEQLDNLVEWVRHENYDELLFVDDVLAFGDTIPTLIDRLNLPINDIPIRLLFGIAASGGKWNGIQNVEQKTNISPEYLVRIEASPPVEGGSTGMAIPTSRDFTFLGGKVGIGPAGEQVSLPYFLPFSEPLKGIVRAGQEIAASRAVLDFNNTMFERIQISRRAVLTMGDIAVNGFGTPFTSVQRYHDKMSTPKAEMTVHEYINNIDNILK